VPTLEIKEVTSVDEFMETDQFQLFTNRCIAYRTKCENEARERLKDNPKALALLNRWLAGECVSEFQDKESGGWDAHSQILWLCGQGCG